MSNDTTSVRPLNLKIEPKTKHDQTNLVEALKRLALEDATFAVKVDPESGEIILSGIGELHLDLKVDRLIREFGIGVICGAPQVAYLETLARPADIDYMHQKSSGGTHLYARVKLRLSPRERGAGNSYENEFQDAPEIAPYARGVEKGVRSVLDDGALLGFPIVDTAVVWYDGAFDADLSTATAFEIAARAAMKEGCEKGGMHVLEPIMTVEIVCPPDFAGKIIGNINGRRGQFHGQSMRGQDAVLSTFVPLANMFGYSSELKSITAGHGTFEMKFSHYAHLPRNVGNDPDDFPPAVGMRA